MSSLVATATAAKSGSTVTASVNGTVVTMEVTRDQAVAAGDVLLVTRVGAFWFVIGRLYAAAPPPPDIPDNVIPPDPKPPTTTGSLVVSPVETRSYRSSGWRTDNTDVYQGQYGGWGNHTGAVFYGSKPRSLAGATVTAASIRVKRLSAGTYAPQSTTMRLVTQATRPGGAPTLTSSTAGPSLAVGASTSSFAVPTAWAQAMVDGTAGGIAFYDSSGSPYVRFAGRSSWSPAFTLTISWRR
ncbi:hypothetical protein [Nakamurella sp.]|uniref:hypothetical protein n=1 Tax=Nakamurella sp. TaxID=1869182 RepID=UPI003B3B1705